MSKMYPIRKFTQVGGTYYLSSLSQLGLKTPPKKIVVSYGEYHGLRFHQEGIPLVNCEQATHYVARSGSGVEYTLDVHHI